MKYPLRNLIFEKIKEAGNMTDFDLLNSLNKDNISLTQADLDKTLLDLEIYGLIRVSWISKDKRRIEIVESNDVPGRIK
jgi:hypothetical protein